MKAITEKLLEVVSDFKGKLWEKSAYSVREDGGCAAIHSTQHTHITPKPCLLYTSPSQGGGG